MRNLVVLVVAASLLSACNSPLTTATPDAASPAPAVEEAATIQADIVPELNPDFPAGFSPDFKYKIRSRKTEESTEGRIRKLVIEFKEGDVALIDAKIQALLEAKGYKRYKDFERGLDLVGDYGKPGHRITVTTAPVTDALKLDADSVGTVYLVWLE